VNHEWFYVLITATDRTKDLDEITAGKNTIGDAWVRIALRDLYDMEAALDQLPPGTHVFWSGPRTLRRRGIKPGPLALPSKGTIAEVEEHCRELGLTLLVTR
jgi:hypothetical protein